MRDRRYPEHERLHAIASKSQTIGEFLDFGLPRLGKGMTVYERIERDCECGGCLSGNPLAYHSYDELAPGLPVQVEEWQPTFRTIQSMLAEYFGIDEQALAREKQEIYDSLA